mgnify:FL=1
MGELIKKQFGRTRAVLSKTLEGVSPEALDIVPEGFNNNIRWQLGHILVTAELFLFKGQEKLPASYNALFGPGSKPANWTGDVPSASTLLEQLNEQLASIQEVDVTTFDIKLENPFIGNETVGELAAMGAFHEAMHVGQIQALTKIVETTKVN